MTEDSDTVELPAYQEPRPALWIDAAIGICVFVVIIAICLSTCGIKP